LGFRIKENTIKSTYRRTTEKTWAEKKINQGSRVCNRKGKNNQQRVSRNQ
jgi:hypothetical protein